MTAGFISIFLAFLGVVAIIVLLALGISSFLKETILLTAVFLVGGVQLVSMGILGEYIGRIYDEVKHRPLYIVAEAPDDKK
jgi:dolichol-phosphate mannosyltransferase